MSISLKLRLALKPHERCLLSRDSMLLSMSCPYLKLRVSFGDAVVQYLLPISLKNGLVVVPLSSKQACLHKAACTLVPSLCAGRLICKFRHKLSKLLEVVSESFMLRVTAQSALSSMSITATRHNILVLSLGCQYLLSL